MGNIQKAGAEVAQDLEARQCEEIWGAASSGVVHRNTRQRADIWAVEEDKGKGVAWSQCAVTMSEWLITAASFVFR